MWSFKFKDSSTILDAHIIICTIQLVSIFWISFSHVCESNFSSLSKLIFFTFQFINLIFNLVVVLKKLNPVRD